MTPSLLRLAGDERLARLVTNGHDAAFSALYDRYRDVLVRYCRSLVRDDQDALDAFQSTMLNALRALREDRRRAPVRPWLFRIAHNESVSVLRRRSSDESLDVVVAVGGDDVHRRAEDREALAGLLEDLGGLTPHQRAALLLRELGGLEYGEVASVLDTTPLAARQAVFAARASLHDQREGRELPCAAVQRRLSDTDRRAARTRAVRAHLRGCDDCRGFAAGIGRRRRAAVLLPVPPAFASSGLLASILESGSSTGSVAGGGVAAGVVAKAAVALSAAVVATGAAERTPAPSARHRSAGVAEAAVAPVVRSGVGGTRRASTAARTEVTMLPAVVRTSTAAASTPAVRTRRAATSHPKTDTAPRDAEPDDVPVDEDVPPRATGHDWGEGSQSQSQSPWSPVRAPRYGGDAPQGRWARQRPAPAAEQPAAEQPAAETTTVETPPPAAATETTAEPEPSSSTPATTAEPAATETTTTDTATTPTTDAETNP
jgi:RNA polymerase sigma factor (sigma-70 family)